ncbi:MAG: anti-sigma factor [Thermomicrobia bacterium]|nr:anti-sigma factor [Thermomicrobia bacterium]MCA1724504.1 anti-sigma factor [Thermomicrobia bacterium]
MSDQPTNPPLSDLPDGMAEAIAAYALEALPPDEEATVVAYLAAHPEARLLCEEYRSIVGMLPYAAALSDPPPFLREGVLRAIRGERTRRRFSMPRIGYRFASAIAACLLLGLLFWNVGLQLRINHDDTAATAASFWSQPGLISYEMLPADAAPHSTGRIYLSPNGTQTGFAVSGLPALPSDKTYQLWFRLEDQTRVSIATFAVDPTGSAVMVLPVPPHSHAYISCGITEEPRGGSPTPTGPRVLTSLEWPAPSAYS